jgi:hypothetical protein
VLPQRLTRWKVLAADRNWQLMTAGNGNIDAAIRIARRVIDKAFQQS